MGQVPRSVQGWSVQLVCHPSQSQTWPDGSIITKSSTPATGEQLYRSKGIPKTVKDMSSHHCAVKLGVVVVLKGHAWRASQGTSSPSADPQLGQ